MDFFALANGAAPAFEVPVQQPMFAVAVAASLARRQAYRLSNADIRAPVAQLDRARDF